MARAVPRLVVSVSTLEYLKKARVHKNSKGTALIVAQTGLDILRICFVYVFIKFIVKLQFFDLNNVLCEYDSIAARHIMR